MTDELEDVSAKDPIRQGDVLVEDADSPDCVALVIVTADCDLTHGKYGTHLTALPVVTLEDYLCDFWMIREFKRFKRRLRESLLSEMVDLYASAGMDDRLPSEDRLVEWPLQNGADDVGRQLGVPSEALETLRLLIETMSELERAELCERLEELASIWCRAAVQMGEAKNLARARTSLMKRLTNEVPGQLPGDVLYLNEVVPGAERGFVALARFPRPVDPDQVSLSDAESYFNRVSYRRVARLGSPFRYRLTQLFGEVYSAIGLPKSYEDERADRFAHLARRLNEEVEVD